MTHLGLENCLYGKKELAGFADNLGLIPTPTWLFTTLVPKYLTPLLATMGAYINAGVTIVHIK